jgi:uncharacterized protein YcfL
MKYKVYYYDKQGNRVDSPEKAEKAEVQITDANGVVEKIQYYSIKPKGKERLLSV